MLFVILAVEITLLWCRDEPYIVDLYCKIGEIFDQIEQKLILVFQTAIQRSAKLHDSHNYQLFLKNVNEVSGWINEKLQIATDESYRDPTNLQGKIQKHQVFDAEVTSNKRRMEAVTVVRDQYFRDCDNDKLKSFPPILCIYPWKCREKKFYLP